MSTKEELLFEFAKHYHSECESYDRTVCHGPILYGFVLPCNIHEIRLINRNACIVRERIVNEAIKQDLTVKEVDDAIRRYA